jgi:LmbE family N-acetylglucosaminyl deacetylase
MTFLSDFFSAKDRVMVVAAHPDDEVLGAGGMMQQALAAGAQIKVVYLTHGDANLLAGLFHLKRPVLTRRTRIRMGNTRRHEAMRAMTVLGVRPSALIFLGKPDLGLMKIWRSRRRRAAFTEDLKKIMIQFRTTHVLAPADFDAHPDHQAAGLFIRTALEGIAATVAPRALYYLVHDRRWPRPRKYAPKEFLVPPKKWAASRDWFAVRLSSAQRKRKYEAILRHESQTSYSRNFLALPSRSGN